MMRDEETAAGSQMDLEHRYCTECMITGENIDRRELREEASALGSSLVVAGSQRKVRLHLHLNEPVKLFELAARYGEVGSEKADDMQRQQEMAHHASRRQVAVVTDSAADLPESGARGARHPRGAGARAFRHAQLPRQGRAVIRGVLPRARDQSAASEDLAAAARRFPACIRVPRLALPRVVYVGLTARVSGTYQSGETAAHRARTTARILTVDSGTAALGQGLVAMRAAEVAAAGGDAEAVRQAALDARGRTRTWGLLVTLEFAVRGGRVPRSVKTVADLLRLTPILAVRADGSVGIGGVLFGRSNPYRRFGRYLRRRLDPARRWRIGIAHANVPEGAELVREAIVVGLTQAEVLPVIPLGTALGVHGGPGCVVVAVQELDPPAEPGVRGAAASEPSGRWPQRQLIASTPAPISSWVLRVSPSG